MILWGVPSSDWPDRSVARPQCTPRAGDHTRIGEKRPGLQQGVSSGGPNWKL